MNAIESLLNLKRWKEDEARHQFALLLRELVLEENRLAGLEEQYKETGRKFKSSPNELIEISEIRKLNRFLERLLDKIRHQREVLVLKEGQVEEARKLLQEASKETRTFEKLDEKQKKSLDKEIKRKEQIRTDENAVMRHAIKYCILLTLFMSSVVFAQDMGQLDKERLDIIKSDIQKEVQYNEKLKKDIDDARKSIDEATQQRLLKVGKIYEAMTPEEAAKTLEKLDEDTAAAILNNLKPRKAGAILDAMDSEKAASISKKLIVKNPKPK